MGNCKEHVAPVLLPFNMIPFSITYFTAKCTYFIIHTLKYKSSALEEKKMEEKGAGEVGKANN